MTTQTQQNNVIEWSNDMCLQLIDHYERFSELWDPKNSFYHSKTRKAKAWETIANEMNIDTHTVRQKMFSLLGSFRSQKCKGKKLMGIGNDLKEVYVSKWFAFDKMRFLLDKDEQREVFGASDYVDIKHEPLLPFDEESENTTFTHNFDAQDYLTEDTLEKSNSPDNLIMPERIHVYSTNSPRPSKKRKTTADNYVEESSNILRNIYRKPSQMAELDRYTAYGQYVAGKLRTYCSKTQAVVEHTISNILFQADMGQYDSTDQTTSTEASLQNPLFIPNSSTNADSDSAELVSHSTSKATVVTGPNSPP